MQPVLRCLLLGLVLVWPLAAEEPAKPMPKASEGSAGLEDLSQFRTVENAVTTRISRAAPTKTGPAAYLGVHVVPDKGKLVVAEVGLDSPAARAGVQRGDILVNIQDQEVGSADSLRDVVLAKSPGDTLRLALARNAKPSEITATLAPLSRPANLGGPRAVLGVQVAEAKEGEGVQITQVVPSSPAAKAKLKEGETILKIDDVPLTGPDKLRDILTERKPGDTVTLTLFLAEKALDLKVTLEADQAADVRGMGWNTRAANYWRKDVYRLGVVLIEYPDVKHNAKITPDAWEESLFSRDSYKTAATGQPAFGSLADYYFEQSYGHLRVEGKVFAPVEVSKKRAEYGEGSTRSALLTEALDKLQARDGKDVLKDFDGLCFIYVGGRMSVARGSLYWPHRGSVTHQGKRWAYFICSEGGERMSNISVFCHEFGHMLGLPDLYARPENPGSEGVSVWCAMSNQAGSGRPQHFCAWSKEKLEWIKPTVIDPAVPQKLILAPIEDSAKECFKVLVRPDGSEYLLLENRRKKGFDQSLPGEGLLIWRVVQNRPILEESHGVEGPSGPRVYPTAVPYPSAANDAFTPYTTPSSRSQLGGGLPVHITNIRRLADGRITFYIGYEYQ